MAVSGIVITLSGDEAIRRSALSQLEALPQLTLGEPSDEAQMMNHSSLALAQRRPAVIDSPSVNEDEACWDEIASIPGVMSVELVCVHFDDDATTTASELEQQAADQQVVLETEMSGVR